MAEGGVFSIKMFTGKNMDQRPQDFLERVTSLCEWKHGKCPADKTAGSPGETWVTRQFALFKSLIDDDARTWF